MANVLFNLDSGDRKEITEIDQSDVEHITGFTVFGDRDDNQDQVRQAAMSIQDRLAAVTNGHAFDEEAAQASGKSLLKVGVSRNDSRNPYAYVGRTPTTDLQDLQQAAADLFGSE